MYKKIIFFVIFVFSSVFYSHGFNSKSESCFKSNFDECFKPDKLPNNVLKNTNNDCADNSLLANGVWLKIKLNKNGIYKLSYDELRSAGITNPATVRLFGWGGGMLPELNSVENYDDMVENRIKHIDNSIIFYAQGPLNWAYSAENDFFEHKEHIYSEYSYFFLTSDVNTTNENIVGKLPIVTQTPNYNVNSFIDFQYYEVNTLNMLKSGRNWYGNPIAIGTPVSFSFDVPNAVQGGRFACKAAVAVLSPVITQVEVAFGGLAKNMKFQDINYSSTSPSAVAVDSIFHSTFSASTNKADVRLTFKSSVSSAKAWLDYITINIERHLVLTGSQMEFGYIPANGKEGVAAFELSGANANTIIWDITNPVAVAEIPTVLSGSTLKFTYDVTDKILRFIAFDSSKGFLNPITKDETRNDVGIIQNQDLHGNQNVDYLIVTHSKFIEQANTLAEFHRKNSNLSVLVATNEEVYNEFSSGTPDAAAIRNFARMFYSRANKDDNNRHPKYLLLFGDGSYDNKNNFQDNTNYVLTFQSEESLSPIRSYLTDDFFGFLDPDEGGLNGDLDIGIGRFPVQTTEQAEAILNKIYNFSKKDNMANWKNLVCFIADDADDGETIHVEQADALAGYLDREYAALDVQKIYLDAYQQVVGADGQRYPAANDAINKRMELGAMIMNYSGHGNERQLTTEQVITIPDILSWKNINKLPVFMTATCEFSRFDDYNVITAGENVLLNPKGGAIALFTTTRLVLASENYRLNTSFYNCVFQKDELGNRLRFGDIMRITKNNAGSSYNKLNFTLLGDPALQMQFPEFTVKTTHINGMLIESANQDTLKALSTASIAGVIIDDSDNMIEDFNGEIFITVFDKEKTVSTLSNDGSRKVEYKIRENVVYKGKASVENGQFQVNFIVPKDISYQVGLGKITYYATNKIIDAHGYYDKVLIGGLSSGIVMNTQPPVIQLFMNDSNFVSGGITNGSPKIFALISDDNGINTTGNGIGHDIVATLDGDTKNTLILNDYFQTHTNSYTSGSVLYPLFNIEPGQHTLKLKAWDVYNNSSEAEIIFVVIDGESLQIRNLINFPNPFFGQTWFQFEHNMAGEELNVNIQIYSTNGNLVREIITKISSDGYKSDPIAWDSNENVAGVLQRGIYVYRVTVENDLGQKCSKTGKLILLGN